MERELALGAYDPALVLAVQAAIAASDAFTIYFIGERSASDRHLDAISVFSRVSGVPDLAQPRSHLTRLLEEKATIEYSGDSPKPKDVERLTQHARRLVDFVAKHLPKE